MSITLAPPSAEFYRCLEKLKQDYAKVKTGKIYYIGSGCCVKIKCLTLLDVSINTKYLNEIPGLVLTQYILEVNSIPTYDQATTVPTHNQSQQQVRREHQPTNTRPTPRNQAAAPPLRLV